jgi:hypothetical protein
MMILGMVAGGALAISLILLMPVTNNAAAFLLGLSITLCGALVGKIADNAR